MKESLLIILTVSFCVLVVYVVQTLREVTMTLKTYRNLESRLIPILDNARRITANVDDITQKVLIQTARIESATDSAVGMIDDVKETVDKYNRFIAQPFIRFSSIMSGVKSAVSILFRRSKKEKKEEQ
ncbi:MAG: hypothetical protein COS94_04625 [Candidatus Hydrogenedentes bacterium CG07_land_8_20_14_0_80_42_17]|nr:MAG: hypothetical protein COS94_04625 [Candidatus Hydrogenedentes bacterium CG07_land_8_20_14_0_80_42_17]